MKKIFTFFLLLIINLIIAQTNNGTQESINDSITTDFPIIESLPEFDTCKFVPKKEKALCFQQQLSLHVIKTFKYPKKARKQNIQGEVIVTFLIDQQGKINVEKTEGGHELLQKEARRIFEKLPKIKPGMQKGKPVKVRYTYPLNFTLSK